MNKNRKLAKIIEKAFTLEELRVLCMDLGVNFEDVPGEGLSLKSREIIDYARRRGMLDELLGLIKEERPNFADEINAIYDQGLASIASQDNIGSHTYSADHLHYLARAEEQRFILPTSVDYFLAWLRLRAASAKGIGVIPNLKFYNHYHLDPDPVDSVGGSSSLAMQRYTMIGGSWRLIPVVVINFIELQRGARCEVWVSRLNPDHINSRLIGKNILEPDWYKSDYDSLVSDIVVRWPGLTRIES